MPTLQPFGHLAHQRRGHQTGEVLAGIVVHEGEHAHAERQIALHGNERALIALERIRTNARAHLHGLRHRAPGLDAGVQRERDALARRAREKAAALAGEQDTTLASHQIGRARQVRRNPCLALHGLAQGIDPAQNLEDVLEILRGIYPLGEAVKRETWIAAHLTRPADLVAGKGRILLAGEGGGFLSCTSGEGISFALNSGIKAGCAVAESVEVGARVGTDALERYERALVPMKRNLAFRMGMFPFMNNYACKNLACLVPTPLVSKMTERL